MKGFVLVSVVLLLFGSSSALADAAAVSRKLGAENAGVQHENGDSAISEQQEREPEGTQQTRESMANDQTATQWTFLLGFQAMNYRTDEIAPGVQRPKGVDRFWMGRVVLPIAKKGWFPFSLLPRFTTRIATSQDGHTGLGASDLFVLVIPAEWGSGRFGIGPLITFPASDERLGLTDWTYGFSAGISQRFLDDRLSLFAVAGQTWGRLDPFSPEDQNVEAPLVINPVLFYQLNKNWYVGTGDLVLRYEWDTEAWLVPLGFRIGRLWVRAKGTWNVYFDYSRSIVYKNWPGSVPSHQFRITLGFSLPVG
jgi:hypothetical protein